MLDLTEKPRVEGPCEKRELVNLTLRSILWRFSRSIWLARLEFEGGECTPPNPAETKGGTQKLTGGGSFRCRAGRNLLWAGSMGGGTYRGWEDRFVVRFCTFGQSFFTATRISRVRGLASTNLYSLNPPLGVGFRCVGLFQHPEL